MAELKEYFGKKGHLLSTTLVELHRLVSIFIASKGFADLMERPSFFTLQQQCQEDEIWRILLLLAITARVMDDANNQPLELLSDSCGTLVKDMARPDIAVPLVLREACNKIIHASGRDFDVKCNDRGRSYISTKLYLYGKKGQSEWKATLDVLSFAEEYTANVTSLDFSLR